MKLNLGSKLYAATAGALALMLLFVGMNIYGMRASQSAIKDVFEYTVQPLLAVQSIDRRIQEIRFRVVAVITDQLPRAGARIHLKENRQALVADWKSFGESNRARAGDEAELIKSIEGGLKILPPLFDRIDALYDKDDRAGLGALMEDDWPTVIVKIDKPLSKLIELQAARMAETYADSVSLGNRLTTIILGVFAVAIVAMLGSAVLIVRSITGPVNEVKRVLGRIAVGDLTERARVTSDDELGDIAKSANITSDALHETLRGVRQAADDLAAMSGELSTRARNAREETGRQTESVMKISAAMQELTVSVSEVSARTNEIAVASEGTREISRDSAAAVEVSATTAERALQAATASGVAMGELSEEISRISDITMVIKEIADQTNLLALNAAIEAARAGETGRGFAVVADEVRKLAERTTASTGDITHMVAAIQQKASTAVESIGAVRSDVERGTEQTRLLNDSFSQILRAGERLSELADDIASGTAEQSRVADQTAQTMESIAQASERTGSTVEGVATTAASTAQTAQQLRMLVERFRLA